MSNGDKAGYANLWVGLNDAGRNNVWRFFDGSKYDGFDQSQQAAWYWGGNHDNAEDQNCAYVYVSGGEVFMADLPCDFEEYGLCEIVTQC